MADPKVADIQQTYGGKGAYDTNLSAADEARFKDWKQKYAPRDTGEDYDLRGAFKAGLKPDPKSGHWPDTYKKPIHPTFSNESQYAGNRPDLSGHWVGDTWQGPVIERRRAMTPKPR